MPQSHYRTDWLCIATSGKAVDGRTIEPQWLIDAAETYTRKTYTAMIWPHHPQCDISEREFTCNLGEVDALKVETEGDVTKLYAQLIPNQFLIEANRQGQKLFTSAEFVTDFAGSGREYLFGLAVTDIPASLGTEKLKFVLAGEEKDAERGSLETFSLGKLQTSKPDKKNSFWSRLFSASKDFTPTPEPNTDKPTEGDGEKMEELKALIQQMLDLLKSGKDAASGREKRESVLCDQRYRLCGRAAHNACRKPEYYRDNQAGQSLAGCMLDRNAYQRVGCAVPYYGC